MDLGVYVHVPFCARRCDYCAFATWTDRQHLATRYVDACLVQVARDFDERGLEPAATVYLGGGTPSALGAGELGRLVAAISRLPDAEVTVECNPGDVDVAMLGELREAGVTRISLGVQSLSQAVLAALGRVQDNAAVLAAVDAIGEAGIDNYSVDLIYGAAGETDRDWVATLQGVLELCPAPTHVSAYALSVEKGTPLARDPARHPDDDVQARRYEIADEAFGAAGLSWYEISNWARPSRRCRHNENYWRQGEYLAVGCAAHGHLAGRRYWNQRTPERYLAAVESGRSPVAGGETLSTEERAFEALELALRTTDGVPAAAFQPGPGGDRWWEGFVDMRDDRATLTLQGRLMANEIATRLTPRAHREAVPRETEPESLYPQRWRETPRRDTLPLGFRRGRANPVDEHEGGC